MIEIKIQNRKRRAKISKNLQGTLITYGPRRLHPVGPGQSIEGVLTEILRENHSTSDLEGQVVQQIGRWCLSPLTYWFEPVLTPRARALPSASARENM